MTAARDIAGKNEGDLTASDPVSRAQWTLASMDADDPRIAAALAALRRPAPRGSPAWTAAMRARPDRLAAVAETVAETTGRGSLRAISEAVGEVAEAYIRTRWRRDRMAAGTPDDLAGRPEAHVYVIMRDLGSFPANSTVRDELTDWYQSRILANPKE